MKKIYYYSVFLMSLLSFSLIKSEGEEQQAPFPVLEKKEPTSFFEFYAIDDVDEVSKKLAQESDPVAAFERLKNEAIEKKNFPIAQKALRDQEMAKGVIAGKKCNQWRDRAVGAVIGASSFVVGLALFYLFKRPMNDEALNRLSDTIKDGVAQIIAALPKNDTGGK